MIEFFQSQFGFSLVLMVTLINVFMGAVAYCILLERKVAAWVQDRVGPNRVGPKGLLQPIADGVKFLLKEEFIAAHVDRVIFVVAPGIAFIIAMIAFAVIPWGGTVDLGGGELLVQVASVDVGLLYILAVGSLGVYGVVLGGWASNNKYSFYGGMRAAAQMLSYEIPMGLVILVVVMTTGHLRLESIVNAQIDPAAGGVWNVLLHPAAFLILVVTAFAETNRAPFDLAEAEQELIGGYQTEYSSMKMALFYLGEYLHMITVSAFMAVLFLGGWELFPFSDRLGWSWIHWLNHDTGFLAMLLRIGVMFGKVGAFIFLFMMVRWTLPRFRFDQLMRLAWLGLVPMSMTLTVLVAVLVYAGMPQSILAPIGNVLIVGGGLAYMLLQKPQITGRQPSMPPVAGWSTSQ